jgi:hypothetical protein
VWWIVGQLEAALDFLRKLPADATLDVSAFNVACGVGVDVSREELAAAIHAEADKNMERLVEDRYLFPTGNLLVRALGCCGPNSLTFHKCLWISAVIAA